MKVFIFLFVLFLYGSAHAELDPKLTEFTLKACKYSDYIKTEDDQIDCVTDIVNCVVVDGGKIDLTKLTQACLIKASKRRIYEQQRK